LVDRIVKDALTAIVCIAVFIWYMYNCIHKYMHYRQMALFLNSWLPYVGMVQVNCVRCTAYTDHKKVLYDKCLRANP